MSVSAEKLAALEAALAANDEAMIRDLQALIRIPSKKLPAEEGAPFGKPCVQVLEEALRQGAALGFDTVNLDNYVGWIEMGQGEEMLGVLAHLDVVPEGDGWTRPPYEGLIENERIYGRGTQDDKGPAISVLYAMKAIRDAGIELDKRVRLILGCDEESGSADIAYYKQHAELPTLVFSPDADYPLVNGEKGMLRLSLTATYEDSEALPRVISARGGERPNIVAPTAEAVVRGLTPAAVVPVCAAAGRALGVKAVCAMEENGDLRIEVTGTGAHAAHPEKGNNAITALVEILNGLPLAGSGAIKALAELKRLIPHGDTRGKSAGIACSDEISGELTMNLGMFQMDEEGFEATLDIRYPIRADHEVIYDHFQKNLEVLCLYVTTNSNPHYVEPTSELVTKLLNAYETVTGRTGAPMCIGGGTYARSFPGGVSFGCLFEDSVDNMHQADEYLPLSELRLNARIMARALVNLAAK